MPIPFPGQLIKGWFGGPGLVRGQDVETSGGSDALADITALQTVQSALQTSILNWKYNAAVLDATNPGGGFLALNNAAKDNATIISFNTTSNVDFARFDDMLATLDEGDFLFLQERDAVNRSILYQVTARATVDGTKVNVPVARRRDQGGEFTADAALNIIFVPKSLFLLNELVKTGLIYNFSSNVQVLDRNLSGVTLPVNAPYDSIARVLFGGASIETTEVSDRVEYAQGYAQGVDYRDNQGGIINDDTHFIDTAAGVSISSNLTASTISYAVDTTFRRLIAIQLQLNPGNMGIGAMLVLLTDPGGTEREFLHVTLDNKIEIDTAPDAVSGAHQTIQGGLGDIVIDDGTWLLMEMVPVSGTTWRIVPVLLKADGTRIEANDIDVDLVNISSEDLGISRSANQRGQILQYKTIQLPGYLSHDALANNFDHLDEKWCFGHARLFESGGDEQVITTHQLRGPVLSTLMSRDISKSGAIGGTGNSVLTLPEDYTDFEMLFVTVVEDGGQTIGQPISTRWLEDNATLSQVRIQGNDSAAWDRTARTLTMDTTSDEWVGVVLAIPRLTS